MDKIGVHMDKYFVHMDKYFVHKVVHMSLFQENELTYGAAYNAGMCKDGISSNVLNFILDSQYTFVHDILAKITCGSGSGAEHSGAVSDYTYYKLIE